jgi:hypothetical protein
MARAGSAVPLRARAVVRFEAVRDHGEGRERDKKAGDDRDG